MPLRPGASLIIDQQSGRLVGEKSLQYAPGAGFVGYKTTYGDFRDVEGMTLPFRIVSQASNAMIGKTTIEFDTVETNADEGDLFTLPPHQ